MHYVMLIFSTSTFVGGPNSDQLVLLLRLLYSELHARPFIHGLNGFPSLKLLPMSSSPSIPLLLASCALSVGTPLL